MYPLIQIGPFRLSTAGLVLIGALLFGSWLLAVIAHHRSSDLVNIDTAFLFALVGGAVGGRLWYGLFNLDVYGSTPELFLALRLGDIAWPGVLLGGMGGLWIYARLWRVWFDELLDLIVLALPPLQVIALLGLLLSGEAFGATTNLPWAIPLFGAYRHPTQIYLALAACFNGWIVWHMSRHSWRPGTLGVFYLLGSGVTLLVLEPLRADSLLLSGGIRSAQVFGLAMVIGSLVWLRHHTHFFGEATRATLVATHDATTQEHI